MLGLASSPATAWWDEGHMQIAYVAYKQLTPTVKQEVDDLLRLNGDYPKWTAGGRRRDRQALCIRACSDLGGRYQDKAVRLHAR